MAEVAQREWPVALHAEDGGQSEWFNTRRLSLY
jgi:hypothetical protein